MAQIIKSNGKEVECKPTEGDVFQLRELQLVVGGYIEIVNLSDDRYMVVNEWGFDKPINRKATKIADNEGILQNFANNEVRGDVLICSTSQIE